MRRRINPQPIEIPALDPAARLGSSTRGHGAARPTFARDSCRGLPAKAAQPRRRACPSRIRRRACFAEHDVVVVGAGRRDVPGSSARVTIDGGRTAVAHRRWPCVDAAIDGDGFSPAANERILRTSGSQGQRLHGQQLERA